MKKRNDINLIALRMRSHAKRSGYDRIIDYLDCREITVPEKLTLEKRVIIRLLRGLCKKSGVHWYNRESLYNEIQAARIWIKRPKQIFHFIYGENSYRYLGLLKRSKIKNHIICTYHTPADKFKTLVSDYNFVRNIDAIIVVSRAQKSFFSELIGPDRVFFVPHGIDTEYFKPAELKKDKDKFKCLFVGRHMRDFNTLLDVVKIFQEKDPAIQFDIVSLPELCRDLEKYKNVRLYSKISDEKLLNMYQNSDVLFLPLIDSTANNSILEAMACGLPVITTKLEGVYDYIDRESAILAGKGDVKTMVDAIDRLKKDNAMKKEMALSSRVQSLKYSWENVAKDLKSIYDNILTSAHP